MSIVLVPATAVLAGGCGGDEPSASDAPVTPVAAVADWLGAVAAATSRPSTGWSTRSTWRCWPAPRTPSHWSRWPGSSSDGLPEATRKSYWESFADGFADVLGASVDQVSITDAENFSSNGERYSAVTVGVDGATTEVITHLVDGVWQVDLVATSGPALAVQIRRLLADLAATGDSRSRRTASSPRRPRRWGPPTPGRRTATSSSSWRRSRALIAGGGADVARGQPRRATSPGVSRILSRATIYLDHGIAAGFLAAHLGRDGRATLSLLGLAPDGVYRAAPVTRGAGGLLHHRFTLACGREAHRRSALCCTFRRVAPPGCYPASCPVESGLSSTRP